MNQEIEHDNRKEHEHQNEELERTVKRPPADLGPGDLVDAKGASGEIAPVQEDVEGDDGEAK